jgi:NAD(P)-dependent dehydrogenase (short-subunit alcohol dehydrogenase family)
VAESATGTAFVTGASRGIGKAVAVYLAKAGFDVAITARTVQPGDGREHSSTILKSDTTPLPGSLAETAQLVEKEGRQALMVPADLLDPVTLGAAAATVIERWGRVDVLVNNGRYVGPGHMDRFMDTPVDIIGKHLEANVLAPLHLIKLMVPAMQRHGGGRIINLTSTSGLVDPPAPAGEGGWGLGYGSSKGAFHRVAGMLQLELQGDGITFFNLDPGYIVTERIIQDMAGFGFTAEGGSPPDVIGATAAWLATSPDALALGGTSVKGQELCRDLKLLSWWPESNTAPAS